MEKKTGGGDTKGRNKLSKNKNYFYGFNDSLDVLEIKMLQINYVKKRPPLNASHGQPSAARLQLQKTPIASSFHPLLAMHNPNSLSEKKKYQI